MKIKNTLTRNIKSDQIIVPIMVLLVLGSVIFLSILFYDGIENRVDALRGSASLLSKTIHDPLDPKASIEYWVNRGFNHTLYLNNVLESGVTFQYIDISEVDLFYGYIQGYTFQSNYFSKMALDLAQKLFEQEITLKNEGIAAKGTTFEDLYLILSDLVNSTQEMKFTQIEFSKAVELAINGGEAEMNNLRIKGIELTNHYYKAKALVKAAIATLPASDVNILAPFILITVIFALFLLFPWILLLLFFLRKKKHLITIKLKMLKDLNLIEKIVETEKIYQKPYSQIENEDENQTMETKKLDLVRDEIDRRGFRKSEYLISLILLTFINAALLYFFFYPHATAGLADHISNGGGVKAFANYLASDATTLTFGFMGAYFFIIQMLLRRYFASDLNPNAYSYATVRIFTVFIFSTFLQLATTHFGWPAFIAASAAFVIGIFPREGLRWILRTTNKLVSNLKAPEQMNNHLLTELEGLNNWHEARLLEENVENVQNLATSSLEDLIINTNFCPEQLIDWVDQALLRMHIQETWKEVLDKVGIRTATDFIENTYSDETLDSIKVKRFCKAIIDIQKINLETAKGDQSEEKATKKPNQKKSFPPSMTKEILESIAISLKHSPNLSKIQEFWKMVNT
jgi:hypothetical protein